MAGAAPTKISCQFPTSLESPRHIAVAESLGYDHAWLFDTPQQSPDVWMMLALAATHTERIGLGPGVLVPTLRHPMVNASGAAALSALAPGRVAVAFGTGFAGARAMGAEPSTWSYLRDYVRAFRALLRGETVDWDGGRMRMLHPGGHGPARPIEVPVLISALGPKGLAVAKDLADGLFTVNGETGFAKEFTWVALGVHGTVLAEGEELDSPRVRAAAGPGNALAYHAAYEFGGDVTALPAGKVWLDVVNRTPARERHLAVHDRHLVALNAADDAAWAAGSWAAIPTTTLTGSAAQLGERLAAFAEQGITEIAYQPTGPDIERELESFINLTSALFRS
ncbi:LLM class flavin-dependent oxidoreductase [Kutzneria buriramensis]|uniref:5,10-methylenetetrahydromethanopterin reductase n=1 Tax=Kutzneria buriramensis TaxID=1045776 RepID=A0A3E0G7C7_9PSEU|nr:LLM class flavin-dependent oxidoreductase [Kutzneria buriramensis]REH17859.1 5,10-methylenetetrahydromethanopterin reductase [Kutzneria buriramensis]